VSQRQVDHQPLRSARLHDGLSHAGPWTEAEQLNEDK
jgi:hypothetical protein